MVETSVKLVSTKLDLVRNTYGKELDIFYKAISESAKQVQAKLQGAYKDESRLDYYNWLDFHYLINLNALTQKTAASFISQGFKKAVVIGMGGSGINAMVLKNALVENNPNHKAPIDVYIQNNLDPSSMLSKLKLLENDLDKTLFVIISK